MMNSQADHKAGSAYPVDANNSPTTARDSGVEMDKTFVRPEDLAIHGAPPAFTQPLHVGRPTMGDRENFLRLADEMFSNQWYTNNGPLVQRLEQEVATYLGVRNCVAMSNGTTALEIAIRALGMTDEVIVPSYTFIATAHALHWQGITPVFADIDPETCNLDPVAVRRMITSRTRGIIGVHLWGRPAPVGALQEIANEHGIPLLLDAAHAFGCTLDGTMIGSAGRAEVLSFHATKFFNSFEGGAIVTNNDDLAETARLMRNFGFAGNDNVIYPGTNAKMTEICAAMGLTNLRGLPATVAANRANYHAYQDFLTTVPGISLLEYDERESNNFQYIVALVDEDRTNVRDQLVEGLEAENVLARRYFWPGCHRMKPYRDLFPNAGILLPVTESVAERTIVLPTGPSITVDMIRTITSAMRCILESSMD